MTWQNETKREGGWGRKGGRRIRSCTESLIFDPVLSVRCITSLGTTLKLLSILFETVVDTL
jgi:hypothetical protein